MHAERRIGGSVRYEHTDGGTRRRFASPGSEQQSKKPTPQPSSHSRDCVHSSQQQEHARVCGARTTAERQSARTNEFATQAALHIICIPSSSVANEYSGAGDVSLTAAPQNPRIAEEVWSSRKHNTPKPQHASRARHAVGRGHACASNNYEAAWATAHRPDTAGQRPVAHRAIQSRSDLRVDNARSAPDHQRLPSTSGVEGSRVTQNDTHRNHCHVSDTALVLWTERARTAPPGL